MNWFIQALVIRQLRLNWRQSLLATATIALGVGVFLSVRLANRAAIESFEGFGKSIGGPSDLCLRREAGSLRDEGLSDLRSLGRRASFSPIIEGSIEGITPTGAFRLMGLDLVSLAGAPEPAVSPAGPVDAAEFLPRIQDPQSVFITAALARSEHLRPGNEMTGWANARPVRFKIAGVIPESRGRPSLERNLVVMDLPSAQAILRRPHQIDRIELALRPGSSIEQLEEDAQKALPKGWILEPPERRAQSGRTITAAFRFNLSLLSALSLAVGAYLLFQELDAMVFRRRETWALLHSLGTPPALVSTLVLLEAGVLGVVGSALGLGLGWAMAQGAVRLVSRTVDTLYGPSSANLAQLQATEAVLAFCLGIGVCVLAAGLPALQAARTPPVESLARTGRARPTRWLFLGGLGVVGLIGGLALVFLPAHPPGSATASYFGTGLVLLGGSLASVLLLPILGRTLGSWGPWAFRLGLGPLRAPTARHVWACASLTVAMSMGAGLGIMVSSFRTSVQTWLGHSLQMDLYIASAGFRGAPSDQRIEPEMVRQILSTPGVAHGEVFQLASIQFRGLPIFVGSLDFSRQSRRPTLQLLGASSIASLLAQEASDPPACFVSETFGRRFGARPGDTLELPTPGGTCPLRVLGVYADFSNERGGLVVDQYVFRKWLQEDRAVSLALDLAPGTEPDQMVHLLSSRFPGLQVRANAEVRREVKGIFDRTFSITYALEAIGLAVAMAGLVQAMVALAVLRREETWTLRALGASEIEIATTLASEGMATALGGTLGGLALGMLLSLILIRIINPQVFGWTIQFHGPWRQLLGLGIAALLASLGSLLAVAGWGARLEPNRELEEGA